MEVRRDKLKFFRTGAAFRRWLEKNHAKADELWLGMYCKDSHKGGITYSEALDAASTDSSVRSLSSNRT